MNWMEGVVACTFAEADDIYSVSDKNCYTTYVLSMGLWVNLVHENMLVDYQKCGKVFSGFIPIVLFHILQQKSIRMNT